VRAKKSSRLVRTAAALVSAMLAAGCSGGGSQGVLMPPSGAGSGGSGNTVVHIYVPAGIQASALAKPAPIPSLPATGGLAAPGVSSNGQLPATAPISTPAPATAGGLQALAINVSGPTTISQTVSVGPNANGCTPAPGGSTCQLGLTLPAGTYAGTVGSVAVAFTVSAATSNVLNLTLGGVPSQIAVVPATATSAANAQGGIDLYGAGKHLLLVEMLDANQNVMVGNAGVNFAMSQAGGSLSVGVTQASATAANLFYVTPAGAAANANTALLRATASSGAGGPCALAGAVCSGSVRVDLRQLLAVANSTANSVSLFVNGQTTPLLAIANGVTSPLALVFDASGDLFVANQPGSVTEYAPPYVAPPVAITGGINHPQALVVDARGDLFIANGNGSNTVALYSPPYGNSPTATIATNVDDPVSLSLDANGDLFVVNNAGNTVTAYAPPYTQPPTVISHGLTAPGSMALDTRGNLFVANLNSTPNSVVEYAPPFSNASVPVATIANGVNEQGSIAVISSNLFVPNQGANTVTEYVPPYTSSPTAIVGGQSQPVALAIDASGNLFVANYGNNTVTEYAPPYAPGSWTTLSNGVTAPLALALSPATNGGATLLP
jgi:hypothetical protein